VGGFVVGSPIFPHVTIALPDNGSIEIDAPAASAEKVYVQNLRLNGQDFGSPWIPWNMISSGGTIEFVLGDSPNKAWGTQAAAAPPSYDIPNL
jgi:putative alpha-1,2-mannosidase